MERLTMQENKGMCVLTTKTIALNFYGAPGTGKSTLAAYAFAQLKMAGVNAELVTEYAKELVWGGKESLLDGSEASQMQIFEEQYNRMNRLNGKVDVIVTDSPLPVGLYYTKGKTSEMFFRELMNAYGQFQNIDIYLKRVKPYNPKGRLQSEAESDAMAMKLRNSLISYGISFAEQDLPADFAHADEVVQSVLKKVNG